MSEHLFECFALDASVHNLSFTFRLYSLLNLSDNSWKELRMQVLLDKVRSE